MTKKRFLGMLAMLLAFGLVFSGCTITRSVAFTSVPQPAGEYRFVTITERSTVSSVLQRFFEMYPSNRYQVIAIEEMTRGWVPAVAAAGGFLLGAGIGSAMAGDDDDGAIIAAAVGLPLGVLGYIIGDNFQRTFLITFVEREGSLTSHLQEAIGLPRAEN